MISSATIRRLVATCADFDLTGLEIIGYYLRLYTIEAILGDEGSTAEFMELMTELMKNVEDYKGSIEPVEGPEGESSVYSLIHDQKKARTYISNFTMSLYNGKLKQIQNGPWDYTLQRGLWCCIDLFSCISKLWEDEDGSLQRRIKYCKVYLTKLAKGEMGGSARKQVEEASATRSGLTDDKDRPAEPSQGATSDDEIAAMLSKLRASNDNETSEEESVEDIGHVTDISLPRAPRINPSRVGQGDEPSSEPEPTFIDSEEEGDTAAAHAVPEKPKQAPREEPPRKFTQDQLHSMMERSGEIEKVQKLAKYAISALNYDDVPTAKDELTKALEILQKLE